MKYLFTYIPILIFTIVIIILLNRERKKTLEKIIDSEKILKAENKRLEMQIGEKAKVLRENRFERMNELSRAAEFGRLCQGIFHDLMTPLTSIILHTERLERIPKEEIEIINKTLKNTANASQRMSQYIENIRSLIRNDQIKKELSIVEKLENILDLLGYKIRNANISIYKNIVGKCIIYCDPMKWEQIFINLISNSIDSYDNINDKRKKEIFIDIHNRNNKIIIEIRDNGCGIKKENLDRIFDPFFSTKDKEKGIGIGLTTVKKIIENDLSGQISIESEEYRCTRLSIELPQTIYRS